MASGSEIDKISRAAHMRIDNHHRPPVFFGVVQRTADYFAAFSPR